MEKRKKSDNSPNNPKETQETTLRQNQKKILTKKDLTNLDDFIQKCLNMFKFVDPKEEFYIATGKEKDLIISHKSTIPDLVIWNKTFNKNECFEEANTKKPNPFPRYQFFLRIKSTKSEKDKKKEKKNEKKEKKSEKSHKNKKKEKKNNNANNSNSNNTNNESNSTNNNNITNNFCNVLDTKLCPIKPLFYAMNNEFIVISDNNYVYVLQYKGYYKSKKDKKKNNNKSNNNKINEVNNINNTKYNIPMNKLDPNGMNEFCFFIDAELSPDIQYDYPTFIKNKNKKAKNSILNIYLSNSSSLYVAKSNGIINKYNLYSMSLERKTNPKNNKIIKAK